MAILGTKKDKDKEKKGSGILARSQQRKVESFGTNFSAGESLANLENNNFTSAIKTETPKKSDTKGSSNKEEPKKVATVSQNKLGIVAVQKNPYKEKSAPSSILRSNKNVHDFVEPSASKKISKENNKYGKVVKAVDTALGSAINTATFGGSGALEDLVFGKETTGGYSTTKAGKIGGYAGYLLSPEAEALTRLGSKVVGSVAKGSGILSQAARLAGGGAAAGAGHQVGVEGVNAVVTGDLNLQERGKRIGEAAAFGAAGNVALGGAGKLLGSAVKRFRGSRETITPEPVPRAENEPIILTRDNPTVLLGQTRMEVPNAPIPEEAMKGNWFTNLFGKQGVGIAAGGSSRPIRDTPLTTSGQIVRRSIKNDKDGIAQDAAAFMRTQYQNHVDQLTPLKKIGAYETAMDASRANNLANTIVNDKFVTPEGQVVGEGLSNIFKKVARGQDKDFVDYLVLRHAKTRMERGEKVYDDSLEMTPEKVQQRIDQYDSRSDKFKNIAQEWDAYNDNMLKVYGVNEGLISPKLYETLREANPTYAPMQRQFLRSEKPGRKFLQKTTSSSFSGQKAPIKEVSKTGSARRIVDPRKTTLEATGAWVNAAMRNRTLQGVAESLSQNPEKYKGIAEIVKKPKDMRDLRDIILKDGENEFIDTLNNEFANAFKKTTLDKDNIVRVMINGEPIHLQIHDPEVVKALIGMGPQASNFLLDILGAFSNATKRGATGLLAPFFATKSLAMDAVQSAIQAKNPAKQAAYTVYALLSGIGDKLNVPGLRNMAQEFRRAGGGYSSALKTDSALNKGISSMTRYPLLSPQNVGKVAVNTIKTPFRILEGVANISENAPRIAAARIAKKGNSPTDIRNSMEAGREATVNYSRKGALSSDLEKVIPYNNAAIQGLRRIGVAFKNNPVRTTAAVGVLAVLPKLYEYSQFADDPDYQRLPARERYRNLIVSKNEDGTFNKVPMSPEYNAIGELTIEALRKFKDGDEDAFKGFQDSLAAAFTPPLVGGALQSITQDKGIGGGFVGALNATVAAPAVATTANTSFTGAPIVPESLQDRSKKYQYDERTTAIAKFLGDKLNQSPKKIDYIISAYGGDAARLLAPITSDIGRGTKQATIFKNFVVDPVMTNTLTNDFYKAKDRITQAKADNNDVAIEFPSWFSDEAAELVTSQKKGSVSKQLSEFNKQKREINAHPGLRPDMKAQSLREVQRKINELLLDTNAKLKALGVPMK